MAATRTSRIELRADPDSVRRIRYAAELQRQSVSAFVLGAAAARADEVITASAGTVVPSDFFDEMWEAFDEPPRPNPPLASRSSAERRVDQR